MPQNNNNQCQFIPIRFSFSLRLISQNGIIKKEFIWITFNFSDQGQQMMYQFIHLDAPRSTFNIFLVSPVEHLFEKFFVYEKKWKYLWNFVGFDSHNVDQNQTTNAH